MITGLTLGSALLRCDVMTGLFTLSELLGKFAVQGCIVIDVMLISYLLVCVLLVCVCVCGVCVCVCAQ